MARVAGVDLPKNKHLTVALTYIYGIGNVLAKTICTVVGIDPSKKVKDLNDLDVSKLNAEIARNFKVEGDLRREIQRNIRRLIEIGSYRGMRHRRNLPARGQRTKSNARTRRGKRKTVGSARGVTKKAAAPSKA